VTGHSAEVLYSAHELEACFRGFLLKISLCNTILKPNPPSTCHYAWIM
jgi:hypothetical protein